MTVTHDLSILSLISQASVLVQLVMALLAGLDEGHVQTHFQLLRNHAVSRMHCRGCPAWRAAALTSRALCGSMVEQSSR